jgi:hypothetical protein
MKKPFLNSIASIGVACGFASTHFACAGVLWTFSESGNTVIATTSGSIAAGWSYDGLPFAPDTTAGAATIASSSLRASTSSGGTRWVSGTGTVWSSTDIPGVSFLLNQGSSVGDTFGHASDNNFYTPSGVLEGQAFTPVTTITWANQSFDSMGLDHVPTSPTIVFTLDNDDTISWARQIPEPHVACLFGLAGLVLGRRRRG